MSIFVQPTCKYGHGNLEQQSAPLGGLAPNAVTYNFVVNSATVAGGQIQIHPRGFTFGIWKCTTCTYLEFHDDDAEKPR